MCASVQRNRITHLTHLKLNSQSSVVLVEPPSGGLHYPTRTKNLRLGNRCDVNLAEMLMVHA
jgi:hypothetical protein